MDVTPLPYIPRPQEEARLRTYLLDRLQGKRGVPKALFLGGAPGVGKRTLLRHVCAGERRLRELRVVHVLPRDAPDPAAEEEPRKGLGKAAEITGEVLNLVRPLEGLVFNGVRILVEEQLFGARKAERVGRPPELSILDADGPVLLIVHGIAPEDVEGLRRYARLVREAHHRDAPVTILFLDASVVVRPADPDGGDPRLVEELPALAGLRRFLEDARQLGVVHLRAFTEAECRETILGLGLSMEWATVLWQISEGRPAELDALWKVLQRRRVTDKWSAGERPIAKPAWKLARDLAIQLLGPRMPRDTIYEPRLVRSLFLAAAMGPAFLPQAVADCAHEVDPGHEDGDREAWEDLWLDVLEREDPAHPALAAPRRVGGGPEILAGDERRFFVLELRHPALVNVLRAALRWVWSGEERSDGEEDEALETEQLMKGCSAIEAWLERSFRKSWSQALDFRAALLRVQNRDREAAPLENLAGRLRLEEKLRTEVERRRGVKGGTDTGDLFASLVWYAETLRELGQFQPAIDALLEAKELADTPDFGLPDGKRWSLVSLLGVVLADDGRYAQAAPVLSEAWRLALELYGSEHPTTLTSIHNYASLLERREEYDEAEPLFRWVLDARERVLGPEHPWTLYTLNNLAALLVDRGDLSAAEPLYRRSLEIGERVLGPDHPDTLSSIRNLAYLLERRGDMDAAEPLYRRAVAGRERVLGPDHPDTLRSVNNLASLLDKRGDAEAAEPLYRWAVAGRERVLGPDHPDTLKPVHNLAHLLDRRGDAEAAEALYRWAVAGRERVLGWEHPDTLISVNNLAHLLDELGDSETAEPLFRRALEACERVLGAEHSHTLAVMNNLASLLGRSSRYDEAEWLHRRVLDRCERALGPDHPYTVTSASNLAFLLARRGQPNSA